jgi:asparagine synthase (glutamine-hydrolysing)
MCGIWAIIQKSEYQENNKIKESFNNVQPRGPDRSNYINLPEYGIQLGFHRLAIMDLSEHGDQPFKHETDTRLVYLLCNGEIYNHEEIQKIYNFNLTSHSDCEKLLHLYLKFGHRQISKICNMLNAECAFIIIDIDKISKDIKVIISQDRLGMRPIFIGEDNEGLYFSSTLNGIPYTENTFVERFEPRKYIIYSKKNQKDFIGYQKCNYYSLESKHEYTINEKHVKYSIENEPELLESIIKLFDDDIQVLFKKYNYSYLRDDLSQLEKYKYNIAMSFIDSVYLRHNSDRPIGALLSGGLDSSLVVAILAVICKFYNQELHTFNIGLSGSTDKPYADMVATHVNSIHNYVELTKDDFINAIEDVIRVTGTYDITTVRASTGQYLIAKWISENTDIKVVFCGEISDELCAGYKYFHRAPSSDNSHEENIRLLEDIHYFDGLRVDRCMASFGLEPRFPFGDYKFIEYYLNCDKEIRTPQDGVEKWLLRESFKGTNLLPTEVLRRPKEAFSDSVSSHDKSWYQIIQEHVEEIYTDQELVSAQKYYSHLPPVSKESLHYRKIFNRYYGDNKSVEKTIPYFWLPKWCGDINEPSARVL